MIFMDTICFYFNILFCQILQYLNKRPAKGGLNQIWAFIKLFQVYLGDYWRMVLKRSRGLIQIIMVVQLGISE